MKRYQMLYLAGITLIIIAVAIYFIISTVITSPDEATITNLFGNGIVIDSEYSPQESSTTFAALNRSQYRWLLWIGIPIGLALLLLGIWLKYRTEGPDVFLDDEIEEDE